MSSVQIYKFGLYGRCSNCKFVELEKCSFCGETTKFTDSSKPGFYLCTNCNTHNIFKCGRSECSGQIKTIRTPKNEDEKNRIEEFVNRMATTAKNRRNFVVKSNEYKKNINPSEILVLDTSSSEETAKKTIAQPEEVIAQKLNKVEESKKIVPEIKTPSPIDKAKETVKIPEKAVVETQQDEAELKLIKEYWQKNSSHEQSQNDEPTKERRIVNEFFDDQHNDELDTQKSFVNNYDETVYYDCAVCGEKEVRYICDKCGSDDKFSLNFDALTCKCGNEIKIIQCRCEAKIGHTELFLLSEGIKWQYSKSRSYYNYRLGRMMVFSTCPSCGAFSAEKCSSCGSKVNFGKPNSQNQVYCKHCGTVNQFHCDNTKCNNVVKKIQNPTSIDDKLELINKARNIRPTATINKQNRAFDKLSSTSSDTKQPILNSMSESFVDRMERKNKELINNTFIDEVEKQVNNQKELQKELVEHNKKQVEYVYHTKKSFKDYWLITLLSIVVVIGVALYIYFRVL